MRIFFRLRLFLVLFLLPASLASAQQSDMGISAHGKLLLVLPFENRSADANLDWIGEGAADVLNRRLESAGFLTISRGDRLYALDHLGLPLNFQPSHATTIRIAQNLDADSVVLGYYTVNNGRLTTTTQVLDVKALKLGTAITQDSDLKSLLTSFNGLSWQVARQLDPTLPIAQQTFLAADSTLRVDAFEKYIRGTIAEAPGERVSNLRDAVRISPNFSPAWAALGRAYFANQEFDNAAATFGRLSADDPNALEADFYRGLAFFYTANYLKAEDAFAFVRVRLPLPEVVNNQGVAASRRQRDGSALFQQASAADPKDEDYHFNFAVSLRRRNDIPGAIRELDQALKLRPNDAEAQTFATALKNPASVKVNLDPGKAITDDSLPLERIKRSYNETGFRQAAYELEQIQAMRMASMAPKQQAEALVKEGDQFMNRGLTLEAERRYQSALAAAPNTALAHSGLAQVREHSGDTATARLEAQKSLSLAPNVPAYLLLARLDLASNQLPVAAGEVSQALHLEPANANARGMKQALEARGQQVP